MNIKEEFEGYLHNCFHDMKDSKVKEAMLYSLLAGGKRIRPMLLLYTLSDMGYSAKQAFPIAAAIEMIHTYSLIHDDLPAMDNDILRRGKPTCHVQYGEATAILAGDALLTHAFGMIAASDYEPSIQIRLIQEFVHAAGSEGMILGQQYDMEPELTKRTDDHDHMKNIDELKTGKLMALPLCSAMIIGKQHEAFSLARQIGLDLGILFQIQDDVLNVSATTSQLGKSTHSDDAKWTYIKLLGLDDARKMVETYGMNIKKAISQLPFSALQLETLIDFMLERNH